MTTKTKMPYTIAVDYDGTILLDSWMVEHGPSHTTRLDMDLINKLKAFQALGAEIILWTCREGAPLTRAVENCRKAGLVFDAVNENGAAAKLWQATIDDPNEVYFHRKIFADIYVDDRAHGSIEYFKGLDPVSHMASLRVEDGCVVVGQSAPTPVEGATVEVP
jgi:hydroxymethylpyrimidine pyrophosphatase-like HAD family hydrolase